MKIAIIADDLTGANDTGVQLARKGIPTSVLIDLDQKPDKAMEALVLDTDSRSASPETAYRRVYEAVQFVKKQNENGLIYKKADSTMRGNIGVELDAMFAAAQPDFVLMAPSFPAMGRVVKGGHLYVDGISLHETSMANDPKNPIKISYLPALLQQQTKREICLIATDILRGEREQLLEKLAEARRSNIPYLLFDAEQPEDLQLIAELYHTLPYKCACWGSAGLAIALSEMLADGRTKGSTSFSFEQLQRKPALIVVGSVSPITRKQLELVLEQGQTPALSLKSDAVLTDEEELLEIAEIMRQAVESEVAAASAVILYSSGSQDEIANTQRKGRELGLLRHEISDRISAALGRAAAKLVHDYGINKLVLTGGDTAKQVCQALGVKEIELLDEVELGVPLGRSRAEGEIRVITKAGGFGSEDVFIKALRALGSV